MLLPARVRRAARPGPGRRLPPLLSLLVAGWLVVAVAAAAVWLLRPDTPSGAVYVAADRLAAAPADPAPGPDGSTGSYAARCGRNADGAHRNADNVIASPDRPGAAQHLHDYVGNAVTSARSDDAALAAAPTTCADGDRSAYYWPVLRVLGEDGAQPVGPNTGRIIAPAAVSITYLGNPSAPVVPPPSFLRSVTGNAKAVTQGGAGAQRVRWSCSGTPERATTGYPECPDGQRVTRRFDFPGCWDGRRTDSRDHRSHMVFAAANGVCPAQTFAVPRLRVELQYDVPPGRRYAIDSFPAEGRAALSDHMDALLVMPPELTERIAGCINSGRAC